MPISDRNPSAQVLNVQGRLFLIDCGEGAQQQFRRMHLSFVKTEAVFISHTHGDHLFGLFGFLSTMAMYGRTAPLDIYGPEELGEILRFYREHFDEDVYEIVFHPLKMTSPEPVHESGHIRVSAFPLKHKVECYGFRFDEVLSERQAQNHKPRSYAYCSDTMPFPELPGWVSGVDILYHEATYQDEMADKACSRFHSTTIQAAQCALEAGVGKLLVGHYSSRIREFDGYIAECRSVFPETIAAQDGDVYEFPYI